MTETSTADFLAFASVAASQFGRPALARDLLARSDAALQAEMDAKFPPVGQGHDPVPSVDGDWPGCTGVLRAYPSGAKACDCGDAAVEGDTSNDSDED
jgi:hypothetical protein